MSNHDEESQESKSPTYKFYSAELNYNYYVEQPRANDAPNTVASSGITSSTASTASGGIETTDAGVALNSVTMPTVSMSSSLPTLKLPPLPPLPALPAPKSIGVSKISSVTSRADVAAEFPGQVSEQISGLVSGKVSEQVAPNKVEYSLIDDLPEPTFEERVAAMKKASAEEEVPEPVAPSPSAISFPTAEQLPAPVPVPVSTPQESADRWTACEVPNCDPDVFSPDFNFNRSLLKIFWRIDSDHNNRVCKNELLIALSNDWFTGDERLLAKLMYEIYEEISKETIFCDAGLSINNILNFELFAELAARDAEPVKMSESRAIEAPRTPKTAPKKNQKSSQSLRSLFKGR
jgi:hypothetical protein